MAAAILLAKAGIQVTVVERRAQAGGRTSTLELDGFKFDTGPTFFLYPRVLREIFSAAGRTARADDEREQQAGPKRSA
ncbi:MAG: FAD-dependent oxidoreductase [Acidobacteriaceae bacterium]